VPDWFSFEKMSWDPVADVKAMEKHDLLIFQSTEREQKQTQAFYNVRSDLDIKGNVNGGWALWRDAVGSRGENRAGDITTRSDNGQSWK